MAKDRKQINVRLDDDTLARLDHVRGAASDLVGAPLTYSDVIRMALSELAKKYPTAGRTRGGKK